MGSAYPPPSPPPSAPPVSYGYPPQQAAFPLPPRKRRTWLIVLSIFAGLALLIVLFVAGLAAVIFVAIKSSEPYQHAIQAANHDAKAVSLLGVPVQAGWYLNGSENVTGDFGKADLAVPVTGSRRKGTIHVVATKSAGHWRYATLELKVDGQEARVNLLPHAEPGASER
jgi:hypothetical protein